MSEPVDVIHDYLRQIDKEMTCSKKKKKQFLKRLQNDMEEFAEEEETTLTKSELEEHFGTPQSIAESFLETEPYSEVKRTFDHKKAMRVFVIAICVVIFVVLIGYLVYDRQKKAEFENGYVVTTLYEEVEGTPSPTPKGTIVYNDETEGVS